MCVLEETQSVVVAVGSEEVLLDVACDLAHAAYMQLHCKNKLHDVVVIIIIIIIIIITIIVIIIIAINIIIITIIVIIIITTTTHRNSQAATRRAQLPVGSGGTLQKT